MRFRFLGGQDCPDWLLCQLASFSQLSSIKFKRLCDISATEHLLNKKVEDDKLTTFISQDIDLVKIHRFIVAIAYIMKKSVGYKCSADDLETETSQIGLPLEHSKILAKALTKHCSVIDEIIIKSIPKESAFDVVTLEKAQSAVSVKYAKADKITNCSISTSKYNSFLNEMEEVLQLVGKRFSS